MRDWPWTTIAFVALAIGLVAQLPLDGWLNRGLSWGAIAVLLAWTVAACRASARLRDWPWLMIVVVALAIATTVPLPFGGWLNTTLFWAAVVGAVAYSVHARRSA